MKNIIIALCTLAGAAWFYQRNIHLHGWDFALQIFFGAFFGWSVSSVILKATGNTKTSKHTNRLTGIITDITYSTIRINNMPRYKVTIKYSGFENTFEPIDPSIQFSLSIGDKAVVYLDPKNPKNASFNLKESITYKSEHSTD